MRAKKYHGTGYSMLILAIIKQVNAEANGEVERIFTPGDTKFVREHIKKRCVREAKKFMKSKTFKELVFLVS